MEVRSRPGAAAPGRSTEEEEEACQTRWGPVALWT